MQRIAMIDAPKTKPDRRLRSVPKVPRSRIAAGNSYLHVYPLRSLLSETPLSSSYGGQATANHSPETATDSNNANFDCNDDHVQSMVFDSAMSEGVDPSVRQEYIAKARSAMEMKASDVRTEGTDSSGRVVCTATITLNAKPELRRVELERAKAVEAMSVRGKYAVYRLDNGKIRAESIH